MKHLFLWHTFVLTLITSLTAQADIFGDDDRLEALQSKKIRPYTEAVAAGVLHTLLEKKNEGFHKLYTDPMSDQICSNERFSNQSSIAYACTGFLVAPDLLVTAGHCATHFGTEIENEKELYCDSYSWMFDYTNKTLLNHISNDSVYRCEEIIYAIYDGEANQNDFALIRLDRPVIGRRPLELSKKQNKKGDSVTMLGHPMGLPMKYSHNAKITYDYNNSTPSLMSNLDAFAGNSGSPVFNDSNEVIGVLVGGQPNLSTYYDETSQCHRYNRCDQNGENCTDMEEGVVPTETVPKTFSEIQRISNYIDLINEHRTKSRTEDIYIGS